MYAMREMRRHLRDLYSKLCSMGLNDAIDDIPEWAATNMPGLINFLKPRSFTDEQVVTEFLEKLGRRGGKLLRQQTLGRCMDFCEKRGYDKADHRKEIGRELDKQIPERFGARFTKPGKANHRYYEPFHLGE